MAHRLPLGRRRGEARLRVMAELFFGDFRFDTRVLRLEGSTGVVEIRARALELLTYLIEHRHRFVPRSELMEQLWPDVTVTDASLTQCVSELRQVLGDSSKKPRYIETRIKKGYRFAAVVYHQPTGRLEPLPPPPEVVAESGRKIAQPRLRIALAAAVLAVVLFSGWWITSGRAAGPVPVEVVLVASAQADDGTRGLAEDVRDRIVTRFRALDGVKVVAGDTGAGGRRGYQLELACTGSDRGNELSVLLRSKRRGDTRWGWTWVVPPDMADRDGLSAEIAGRVIVSVVSEIGLSEGPASPGDPRLREGSNGPDPIPEV